MVQSTYAEIKSKIEQVATGTSRNADSVCLVCVSKTFSGANITAVLEAGARVFGENRVQEAQKKWPQLRRQFEDVELHLIGPLQSNKTAEAVALFDVIHTIDREKIAATISREIEKQNKPVQLFVQVNTGEEAQKAGVLPVDTVKFVAGCRERHNLDISGLMCIPPFNENPGPHFALLKKLANECNCRFLSMGMSSDFETAIEFGATHVRVGSAIFGKRG